MPRVNQSFCFAEQLRLFEGGPDLMKLRLLAQKFTGASRAANTVLAYARDWRDFSRWCGAAGGDPLPASDETLALYVVRCLQTLKVSTVERRLAAILDAHLSAGHAAPAGHLVRDVMRGARREYGMEVAQKSALRVEDLRVICKRLYASRDLTSVRDRALLTLGFAAGMRRSEISALDLADVEIQRRGVVVRIRRGKTDQDGRGRSVGIFPGTRVCTCPVKSLRAWLYVRGKLAGPLFPGRDGGRLDGNTINKAVKRCVVLAGLDPRKYGAHSLRAGCVTAAAQAGVPESLIMQRTGHRSVQTVAGYVRPASVFAFDVLAKAL